MSQTESTRKKAENISYNRALVLSQPNGSRAKGLNFATFGRQQAKWRRS
jgi:hypothetical protein